MTTQGIEHEVLTLERRYWQALKDGDLEAVLRLTDDPCVVTGAQGVGSIDHKAYRAMMTNPSWRITSFELKNPVVRQLRDDVAVIAYRVHEELMVDGEPVAFDAADASTWVRRDGRWVCALHTESLSGDPFGRDRGS